MTETGSGHGWVYRIPGGARARCGGPGLCPQCSDDLARLAATAKPRPGNEAFEGGLEAELQRTFDNARAAT